MFVLGHEGEPLVNLDMTTALGIVDSQQPDGRGPRMLAAYGPGSVHVLCRGTDETCHQALDGIAKNILDGTVTLDLRDVVGGPSHLSIAKSLPPNGGKR